MSTPSATPTTPEVVTRGARLPILVYGTLRRCGEAHAPFGLARRTRFLGRQVLRGWLYDLGAYPGFRPGWGYVPADCLLPRDPELLAELDAFEGVEHADPVRGEYRRIAWPCRATGGPAWLWVYNGAVAGKPLCSGGWLARSDAALSLPAAWR
jgi:gamma-glutamylcyclotransferase (GGCT)/AIG2-like uncharacterized protein YtfP